MKIHSKPIEEHAEVPLADVGVDRMPIAKAESGDVMNDGVVTEPLSSL